MPSQTASALRVLVVGAGATTNLIHLPILARLRDKGDIRLVLVCDIQQRNAAAARRKFGFLEDGGDARAALERPDIDAVYIFGSAQMHHEYGLRALRSGKHLFVEKPIAPNFVAARAMAETARERGLVAVGGHNRRFHKSLAALRARAGKAGWRFAEAVFHKPEFGKPPLFGAQSWLGANGIHALDALVYMMGGLPEQLTALTGDAAEPGAFSAIMRWRDGAQGTFLCNNNAGARRERYTFHAPGETCSVTEAGLAVEKNGTLSKTAFPAIGDGFAAEHDAFLEAIRSGIEPRHSIAALAPSLYLAELIESGFSGRVALPAPETPRPPHPAPARSVLLIEPAGLQPALARLLPDVRFVSPDEVRAAGPRPDIAAAILGRGAPPLPADLLDRLPGLGIVGVQALSLVRYEPEALLARGIVLVNAGGAYAESVAEFALGLAILGRRRAFASHEVMRAGGWGVRPPLPGIKGMARAAAGSLRPIARTIGLEPVLLRLWRKAGPLVDTPGAGKLGSRDLKASVAGLIGWGANARAFAKRLVDAGARVLVYSQHGAAEDVREAGANPASLAEVLAADIVSLHRGLSERTRHFLGAAELDRLRPGAVLINTARGALIEPQALLARLARGDIFACLDTYEEEPLAAAHPLRRLPNVFLTSHIAGGSPDMQAAAGEEVVGKVAGWLRGDAVETISAEQLRSMT